ncbi:MAG TPA: hypothetical protein OIM43_01840 [Prevotellaceae bacterium]|nr:hypothetical protein [Prevotellaceae bacterium]
MKIKNLLDLVPMLVMSLCLVSCGGDDDEDVNNGGSNGDNTEIKGDYTATTSVKTVTLTASYVEGQPTTGIKIYEDFNNLYSLVLSGGSLCLPHYGRSNGQWSAYIFRQDTETGIKDIGKVTSLQDIKIKNNNENDYRHSAYGSSFHFNYSTVQPNHGYAAYFTTENDEIKNLHIFIKDYTLDDAGSLASITIQYQLY